LNKNKEKGFAEIQNFNPPKEENKNAGPRALDF